MSEQKSSRQRKLTHKETVAQITAENRAYFEREDKKQEKASAKAAASLREHVWAKPDTQKLPCYGSESLSSSSQENIEPNRRIFNFAREGRKLCSTCDRCEAWIVYSQNLYGETIACPNCQSPVFLKYPDSQIVEPQPRPPVVPVQNKKVPLAQVEQAARDLLAETIRMNTSMAGMQIESLKIEPLTETEFIAIAKTKSGTDKMIYRLGLSYNDGRLYAKWIKGKQRNLILNLSLFVGGAIALGLMLVWNIDHLIAGRGDIGITIVLIVCQFWLLLRGFKSLYG